MCMYHLLEYGKFFKNPRQDLNLEPSGSKPEALPLSYKGMESPAGFAPASTDLQSVALLLGQRDIHLFFGKGPISLSATTRSTAN